MSILFLIVASLTILSALTVVLSPSPVYAVLALVGCFFTLAAHFLLMGSPFLAAVQVIVYAGAVMVLFLFTLMVMNLNVIETFKRSALFRYTAIFLGVLLLSLFFVTLQMAQLPLPSSEIVASTSIQTLGKILFSVYTLPFEISAVLFLSAVVCVVMLGKSQQGEQ